MEKKRARNIAINATLFSVGIIIIIVMLYFIGARDVVDAIARADRYFLGLSVIFLLSILAIKLARWWILLKEAGFLDASRVYLIGMAMNLIAPIGTGEITRAAVAKTKLGIKARNTMAAVVIERISDITFVVAMACVCFILFLPGRENLIFIVILVLILGIAYILLFKPQLFDRLALFIERLFERRGEFLSSLSLRISVSLTKFKEAIIEFHKRKGVLGINIILTVASFVLEAVVTYTLLLAFDVASPPMIFYLLVINATSWVARTFLFLPVGPKEVTFILLLKNMFDIPNDVGSAVALTFLAMNYLELGLGAGIAAFTFPKTGIASGEEDKSNEKEEKDD